MSEQNKIEQIKEETESYLREPKSSFNANAPEYILYLLQLVDELNGALDEPKKNLLFQMHNERIKKYEVIRERNELLRKIERKDEALRFYADKENYRGFYTAGGYWKAPANDDDGNRAREAL
jgi:hypothetical protein